MKKIKKILIIIQRSNGDVLMSASLINSLYYYHDSPKIDILVNEDTFGIAKLLANISTIHLFSYNEKEKNNLVQEKIIIKKIFRNYDLSINLTSSDRSVFYSFLASNYSISAIDNNPIKSWWKKIILKKYYFIDEKKHILLNNLEPLNLLNIQHNYVQQVPDIDKKLYLNLKKKLSKKNIKDFIIFHPSAQYNYKIYPKHLRDKLLLHLNTLGIPILVTGSLNKIDTKIKEELTPLENVYDMIGETSIAEYFALSDLALAYVGMDTLNMHIAAGQNKPIFAIFGPTFLKIWSPWSNQLQTAASKNMPYQTYGNITIFQANMQCVACGKEGCGDSGRSECLFLIDPKKIFNKVQSWFNNARI